MIRINNFIESGQVFGRSPSDMIGRNLDYSYHGAALSGLSNSFSNSFGADTNIQGSAPEAPTGNHLGVVGGMIIAAGISAAISGLSAWWSNKKNKDNAREQMAWQSAEQEKQNAWQEEMWNKSNDYNSPAAQIRRYREAGINPYIMFDSGNSGMSGQTSPMSAAGSGVSSVAWPSYSPLFGTPDVGNLASSLKAIADAKKAGVETSRLEAFTDAELENLTLDAAQKKFNLQLDQMFAGKKRTAEINQINEDINLKVQQSFLAMEQGNVAVFEATLKHIEGNLLQAKIDKGYVNIFIENMKREGKLLAAQTKQANSAAGKNIAETNTINQTRSALIDQLRADITSKRAGAFKDNLTSFLSAAGLSGDGVNRAVNRLLHGTFFGSKSPEEIERDLNNFFDTFGFDKD